MEKKLFINIISGLLFIVGAFTYITDDDSHENVLNFLAISLNNVF